jgi:hypothetical protein
MPTGGRARRLAREPPAKERAKQRLAAPSPTPPTADARAVEPGRLWRALARRTTSPPPDDDGAARASLDAMRHSRGAALAPGDAARFSEALGAPLDGVRVHTDDAADRAALAVQARAVTTGSDVYFARGEYRPGTPGGDRLLAHELTHAAYDARARSGGASPRLSRPDDEAERRAERVETSVAFGTGAAVPPRAPLPPPAPAAGPVPDGVLHRVISVGDGLSLYDLWLDHRARAARDDVVELQGRRLFEPNVHLRRFIETATRDTRESVPVRVRFGDLAVGVVNAFVDDAGVLQSDGPAALPLWLTGLGDDATGSTPMLVLSVRDGVVRGVFGGVSASEAQDDPEALEARIRADGAAHLLRFHGLRHADLRHALGELRDGRLTLPPARFDFDLCDVFRGHGSLEVRDAEVSFAAEATLSVPGLDEATLALRRDPDAGLSGSARLAVRLAGFDGSLLASFGRGVLDIRGTVLYAREGFEGSLTLMVTQASAAWAAVDGQLAQWNVAALEPPPAAGGEAPLVAAPAAPGADLALAGWGVVDFRYKDWLHGRAQVIVDPAGDVTSLGRIHLPRSIRIFDPIASRRVTIADVSASHSVGSIWADVVSVRIGASGTVTAVGAIGPANLVDLHAAGAFSTRRGFPNHLVIGGRVELLAGLSIEIALAGWISVEAQVPVLGHASERFRYEVASTRLRLTGRGDIEAYASAEAALRRTQPAGGGEAEYLLSGTLAAGGAATVTFGGGLDVHVPGHTFHVLEFAGRRWHLGSVRGSVPFRNFRIGASGVPTLRPQRTSIPIRPLLSAVVRDSGVPDTPGPSDASATWTPDGRRADVVEEAPDPTPPVIPADPRLGEPVVPPVAPPSAPQGPAPDPGSGADAGLPQDGGPVGEPSEAGPVDAGVPPIAGVPEPPPEPDLPPEPPPAADVRAREVDVPFDMQGTPHHLTLTPGDPPVLLMSSEPGRLVLKLQRKHHEVDSFVRGDPIRGPARRPERDALEQLIAEARQVEQQAELLGFGERFTGAVPGLAALATRLHEAARQFRWNDITAYLPGDPAPAVPEPGEAPLPPTALQVLGLPFPQFLAHVDGLQPAEALPFLREQRRYFAAEMIDIAAYLQRMRSERRSDTYRAMEQRSAELSARIGDIDLRIHSLRDVVNPDARPTLPCFAPETPVLTPDGPRPIGSLREGDAVWSCDPRGGAPRVGRVAAVHRNVTLRFVRVGVGGQELRATGRHPFWVCERVDWVAAEELRPGEHLLGFDGSRARVESLAFEAAADAPTVDLSVLPQPAYFVGPGVLVHNTPAVRHYQWRDASGASVPAGAYKIYLGTNSTSPEWDNCVYIGQTMQAISKRQDDHRTEARDWLAGHGSTPDHDRNKRYYRFKRDMVIRPIADGLLNVDQADWLEQKNIDFERRARRDPNLILNRREELRSSAPEVEARLRADPIVRASGYCP